MNLFDRVGRLIRANLNDLLRRAEDPEKVLRQALLDMKAAYRSAKSEVASAIAELRQLEREEQAYLEMAESWRNRAKDALKAGREDLAREALKEAKQAEALARGFADQIDQQREAVERLKVRLKALEAKISEAEGKMKTLVAKKKSVQAAEAVRRLDAHLEADSALEAFREMESRINAMEDRHQALVELDEAADLEKAFEELQGDDLEAELDALKKELGQA